MIRLLYLSIFVVFSQLAVSFAHATTWTSNNCDFCNIQFPSSVTINGNSPTIFSQYYLAGFTDVSSSPYSGVSAELGYGPHLSDPTVDTNWIWNIATPNIGFDFSQNNDEYFADLSIFEIGAFSYTFRYSVDGGLTWTAADQDGNQNGLQLSLLGTATVNSPSPGAPSVVPVPAAVWLFGTALIGLIGFGKRKSRLTA